VLAIIGGRARNHRRILLEISETGGVAALTFGDLVLTLRGASSAAAKIYSNDALFGPVPVGFRVVRHLIAEYGVLQRISSSKERQDGLTYQEGR
jgi:hypothetical protein